MAILFPNTTIDTNVDRLRINSYFRSSDTTVPAFWVRTDYNSPITTSNGRPINWTYEVFDNGNNMGSQYFTAPIDGTYFFYVWLMDENDGANTNDYYRISRNGASGGFDAMIGYSTGQTTHHYQWPTGSLFQLNEGDNVSVYVYRMDTGLYGNSAMYTSFCGCYLGRL